VTTAESGIVLLRVAAEPAQIRTLTDRWFGDMVKFVVDLERRVLAAGGELHADAEAVLLADGSRQEDLWGANYYPDQPLDSRLEYTSLINIRPNRGNRKMEIQDPQIRERVRRLALSLLAGEPEGA
jgi:hypothetical protein